MSSDISGSYHTISSDVPHVVRRLLCVTSALPRRGRGGAGARTGGNGRQAHCTRRRVELRSHLPNPPSPTSPQLRGRGTECARQGIIRRKDCGCVVSSRWGIRARQLCVCLHQVSRKSLSVTELSLCSAYVGLGKSCSSRSVNLWGGSLMTCLANRCRR